jgi:putative MATE family efflux protein
VIGRRPYNAGPISRAAIIPRGWNQAGHVNQTPSAATGPAQPELPPATSTPLANTAAAAVAGQQQTSANEGILRPLAALAIPIVLANTIHTSHQLVNTFWVGRLGADAVAAVSVSFPVIFLLISIGAGLSIAGSILAAQYAGAGNRAMVGRVAGQTLGMTVVVALLLTAAGVAAAPPLLGLMQVAEQVFDDALAYMRLSFLGILWMFLFAMYQALMRAVGDTRRPLYVIAAAAVLNAILDPILIFGWGPLPALGVAGAACATLITQALCALIGLRLLFSTRFGLELKLRELPPDWSLIGRIVRLGLPASLEQAMQALGIAAVTLLVTGFGTLALAAYGIGFRVLTFVIIPAFGISMAASTLVGHSIGAGDLGRARRITRVSAWTGLLLLGSAGLLVALAAAPIVRFFVPQDPALVMAGAETLRWMALSFGFSGVQLALAGTFRGAGDTIATMALAAVGVWLVLLPLAWLLSTHLEFGARGVWIAYPIAGAINLLLALLYLRHGRWQRMRLTAESRLASQVNAEILIEEGRG